MIKAGLLAAASALCALGALLSFAAGVLSSFIRPNITSTFFLCTFVLGLSARLCELLKLRLSYTAEERKSLADSFDRESATTSARRQFETLLERRKTDSLPLPLHSPRSGTEFSGPPTQFGAESSSTINI